MCAGGRACGRARAHVCVCLCMCVCVCVHVTVLASACKCNGTHTCTHDYTVSCPDIYLFCGCCVHVDTRAENSHTQSSCGSQGIANCSSDHIASGGTRPPINTPQPPTQSGKGLGTRSASCHDGTIIRVDVGDVSQRCGDAEAAYLSGENDDASELVKWAQLLQEEDLDE